LEPVEAVVDIAARPIGRVKMAMMAMTHEQVQRWLDGFDALAQADRTRAVVKGPQPAWSVAVALSLIEAASATPSAPAIVEARRIEDEAARAVWHRLKALNRKR
jgi:hypothetical protein